jgi:hypothetical protein
MKAPVEPLAFGKYSENQHGKIFALRSMEVKTETDGLGSVDETA